MAMSKPSSSFLDLENAKTNIEAAKKSAEKKDRIDPYDATATDIAGHSLNNKPKTKRKSEAKRIAAGEVQPRQIVFNNDVLKAIKREQAERFDEMPTFSDIIDEALRSRYNL